MAAPPFARLRRLRSSKKFQHKKSFAVKVIVIPEGRFRMEIVTSFRKVFVISQGIPNTS